MAARRRRHRLSPGLADAATVGVPFLTLALLIGVQHTQSHDDLAMQLKMDEIIRVLEGTREHMMNVEDEDCGELERLQTHYRSKDTAAHPT